MQCDSSADNISTASASPTAHATAQAIASYWSWWESAGLEVTVSETPTAWLEQSPLPRPPTKPPSYATDSDSIATATTTAMETKTEADARSPSHQASESPAAFPAKLPESCPDTLVAFQQWLAESPDVFGADWQGAGEQGAQGHAARQAVRCLPRGAAKSPLMIISLFPEATESLAPPEASDSADNTDSTDSAGRLVSRQFAPPANRLLERMLRALGYGVEECYWATIALTRPPRDRIEPRYHAGLRLLILHHIALAAPTRLLLVGRDVRQILAPQPRTESATTPAPTSADPIEYITYGAEGTERIETLTIPTPTMLLGQPKRKATTWQILRLLSTQ